MIEDLIPGITFEMSDAAGSSKAPPTASSYRLERLRHHKTGAIVALRGIDDANKAELLVGKLVSAHRNDLPELEDGQYYDTDLIGCEVLDAQGIKLGRLTQVIPTGANDVYAIEGENGEILAPAISGVVLKIDVPARRIHLESSGLVWPDSQAPGGPEAVKKG